jgi:hypothetical protein
MESYECQSTFQPLTYALPTQHANMQNIFEEPWTPIDSRVPIYPVGFAAFVPSPEPSAELVAENSHHKSSQNRQASKPRVAKKKSRSLKGKGKANSHEWEHMVVAKGGLQHVYTQDDEESIKKPHRIRMGKLDPQTKEKARRMRRIRACWNCWIQKVPVRLS